MRVFAISDLHADYDVNAKWLDDISIYDFTEDAIIIAGDVSDSLLVLERTLRSAVRRFKVVLFTPGNHDLWHFRDKNISTAFDKYERVSAVADASGARMRAFRTEDLCILPLLSWYDYSFGQPDGELLEAWMDYRACQWPENYQMNDVAAYFEQMNLAPDISGAEFVITFSHFLPRIDVLPWQSRIYRRLLHPVLGAERIDRQLRAFKSKIHVYGHSHFNQYICIDGITYVNNALGYPHETGITSKRLLRLHVP